MGPVAFPICIICMLHLPLSSTIQFFIIIFFRHEIRLFQFKQFARDKQRGKCAIYSLFCLCTQGVARCIQNAHHSTHHAYIHFVCRFAYATHPYIHSNRDGLLLAKNKYKQRTGWQAGGRLEYQNCAYCIHNRVHSLGGENIATSFTLTLIRVRPNTTLNLNAFHEICFIFLLLFPFRFVFGNATAAFSG